MMLSYDEYVRMGGAVSLAAFEPLEARAVRRLNAATMRRVRDEWPVRESVKRCLAELIDLYAEQAETGGRFVSEEQNGDLRVRYSESADVGEERDGAILRLWLEGEADGEGTALLYRGRT